MNKLIIDTPYLTSAYVSQLAAANVGAIIRYYNYKNSHTFPNKRLTLSEAQKINAQNIKIGVVFEQNASQLSDFSTDKGDDDAVQALACAKEVGQPGGSAIYFAVDHDFFRENELTAITDYFQGINNIIGDEYEIGVYGSGGVAALLYDAKLVSRSWLSGSLGWWQSRQFKATEKWDLFQYGMNKKVGSIACDLNTPNPINASFGAFSLP